jgi:hypothetical protein
MNVGYLVALRQAAGGELLALLSRQERCARSRRRQWRQLPAPPEATEIVEGSCGAYSDHVETLRTPWETPRALKRSGPACLG